MDDEKSVRLPRKFRLRGVSWLVLAIFVAAAIGLFVGTRHLATDADHRLLDERASEVGLVVSSSVGTAIGASVASLAQAAARSTEAFDETANTAATAGNVAAAVLAVRQGSSWVVQAAAGEGLQAGQALTGPRQALLDSAGPQLKSDIYPVASGESRLAVAVTVPSGAAILAEYKVDPTKPTPLTQAQPFHELNAAFYVSDRADPKKLLLSTTSDLPLKGHTSTAKVTIGADTWLVVASAREPLSGDLAHQMPLILFGAVLVIGIAVTALIEGVGRRRDYALAMVAERTTALEQSLAELETAQQKVVATERLAALGQMAATVGHELRNPLGVLTNSMYLIRSRVADTVDDKLGRQLDTADREIAAATLIVSDLLEFSRPRTANPISVDVLDLLDESVSVAPPPSGIEVVVDRHPVPPVFADRDQLRQVILNLLTNAYEAMPEGGVARLSAQQADDKLEIVVADTGQGIDDETLSRIFDPFFSKKTKGTGLGLSVSKRIVEAHDGSLRIESRPGQGCKATISLPLASVSTAVTS